MFKVRNEMVPSSVSNLFQGVDDVHNHQARQMQLNYLPPSQTTISRKNVLVTGVQWLGIVYLATLKNAIYSVV